MTPLVERPRLCAKVRLRLDRKSERYLLLYPERGLELNGTAAAIAGLLDGVHTVAEIVETLSVQYTERPREVIERDVLAFLTSLQDRGLIEAGA